MPRHPRLNPEDGIHHVNNHVVGADNLFIDDQDRRVFLRLMEAARGKYEVSIPAYCLMGNHFHVVVVCPQANLDRFMQHVQSRYVRYFNNRWARRGALFAARYHNKLVTTDGQLQFTLRYVDRNPLELGIDISSYPWGSYGFYKQSRSARDELVTIDPGWVLGSWGSPANYVAFVERDAPHAALRRSQGVRNVRATAERDDAQTMRELLDIVAELSGLPVAQVLESARGRTNDARLAVFLVASESPLPSEVTRVELGCPARSTFTSTVDRARRRQGESHQFSKLVEEVSRRWSATLDTAA